MNGFTASTDLYCRNRQGTKSSVKQLTFNIVAKCHVLRRQTLKDNHKNPAVRENGFRSQSCGTKARIREWQLQAAFLDKLQKRRGLCFIGRDHMFMFYERKEVKIKE